MLGVQVSLICWCLCYVHEIVRCMVHGFILHTSVYFIFLNSVAVRLERHERHDE